MMHNFSYSTKDPYVPSSDRWVATISDGRTIFMDLTPNEKSTWIRLREVVESTDIYITSLRLEAYGGRVGMPPYKNPESGDSQVNGYWQSKRICKALNGSISGAEYKMMGIGYVADSKIHITWIGQDGVMQEEVRPLYTPEGDLEPGVILQ